jgi:GT2 family glycosyltransferase
MKILFLTRFGQQGASSRMRFLQSIAGYFEEVDLLYRGGKLGRASVYFTGTQAFHAGEGTSRQMKAKRLFYSLRSRLLYAFKHFNPFAAMAVLLTTLFVEPMSRSGLSIGRRSWSSFKETWVVYGMLFRWLPDWIFKGTTH